VRKDVLIKAPAARFGGKAPAPLEPPPLEELYRLTNAALRDEKRKTSELSDFCRQTASLSLALVKLLVDHGHASEDGTVTIPRWLHQEMLGASVQVGEKADGDLFVRIAERGTQRIHLVE
jgi:hypothetical protein